MQSKSLKFKRIVKIIGNVAFYGVIALLITFSIANIQVKREDNIANVFGVGFLSVQSDSMAGSLDDNFDAGDMIFVRMLNSESRNDLEVGDIITFYDRNIKAFNTHRIIEKTYIENQLYLTTKGDNRREDQADSPIHVSEAISVYQSSISGLGTSLDYLQTPTGFALFIILPVVFVLIFEGVILVKNVLALNHAKMEEKFSIEKEKAQLDLVAEKEKLRLQILAELKEKQEKNE